MAWPAEAGSLGLVRAALVTRIRKVPARSRVFNIAAGRGKYYFDARGKYRVFNAAEYRFYRDNSAPPAEDDSPFATNATLPHEPADVYADGTWHVSVSYFNGVIDSGFLPIGAKGETYLRLDLAAGVETGSPPTAPGDARIENIGGGVVRILAYLVDTAADRAEQWAIAYSTDGSTPAADAPDVTQAIGDDTLAILDYDLPAQSNGTTVKVRLQTRRLDGSWVYSEGSTVLTITADAAGPSAPPAGENWPGQPREPA